MAWFRQLQSRRFTVMRQAVTELGRLGPLPESETIIREQSGQQVIEKYQKLIMSLEKPITDAEARVLVRSFGRDDAFGLVWPLVHLIESAPGWPLADCLHDPNNEWVQMLKQRADSATR
jgi:hypothetical protein